MNTTVLRGEGEMTEEKKCVFCGGKVDNGLVEFMSRKQLMIALNALERSGIKILYDEKGNPKSFVCSKCLLKAITGVI